MNPTHYLRDTRQRHVLLDTERAILTAPLDSVVTTAAGGAHLGVLVTLIDVIASDPAMASAPEDWMATRDLALFSTAPVTVGPIVIDVRLSRRGSTGVVVDAEVYDGGAYEGEVYNGDGRTDLHELAAAIDARTLRSCATGLITFARITRAAAPGMDDYQPGNWIGQVREVTNFSTGNDPIYGRLGVRENAPGELELDCSSYVVNSIGTITGGAQAALVEMAATSLVPDHVAVDLQMHFFAQLRSPEQGGGPMRTECRVVRRTGDHSVVRVDLRDGERLLTRATVTAKRQ